MYWGGQGLTKNIEKNDYYSHLPFDWCLGNKALDDFEIWTDLGWMYERGRGVEQDDEQAVFWYRKAANQSHAAAQCNLGWMYDKGRGVEQAVLCSGIANLLNKVMQVRKQTLQIALSTGRTHNAPRRTRT